VFSRNHELEESGKLRFDKGFKKETQKKEVRSEEWMYNNMAPRLDMERGLSLRCGELQSVYFKGGVEGATDPEAIRGRWDGR
jgi:hypothetical protein